MIFYFTGTGNSQYAAKTLAAEGEVPISIVECLRKDRYEFAPAEGEAVGIVFPVYYGGLPVAVRQFIERLRLASSPAYLYGIMTYGGSPAGAGAMLREQLGEAGLKLDAAFGVRMPANYAVLYNIPSEGSQQKTLRRADQRLERIRTKLSRRTRKIEHASAAAKAASAAMYPAYQRARKTAPFHTNDTCIGCAACANRCPSRAIEMKDGHPTWVKERCSFCMSCVRCGAIEYGSKLTGKARYKHPMLRKKTDHDGHGGAGAASHDHGDAAAASHDHSGAASAGHDHGGSAGAHDHGGGDDCCCAGEGGHDHGSASSPAHDHGSTSGDHDHGGGDDCCCTDEGGHDHGVSPDQAHDHGEGDDCCGSGEGSEHQH